MPSSKHQKIIKRLRSSGDKEAADALEAMAEYVDRIREWIEAGERIPLPMK